MHVRIAIDLGRRGLEDAGAIALGAGEGIAGAEGAGERRPHGIGLVVDRRGRAGEIVDLVEARQVSGQLVLDPSG